MRPALTTEQSPRLRVERPVIVHSDQSTLDNNCTDAHSATLRTENQKTLHHMARSSRSPIGINLLWETSANPPVAWQPWLATLKMAVMAQHNIEVEKLLRLKPAQTELFYPTMPTLEEKLENETLDEARQREQRNEKRRVDWENECKLIEAKCRTVDRIPWDEADMKVKSLIYLSPGAEACRTIHQRNPHTRIDRCTTNELVHEMTLTFTRPRNITFDRFQYFTTTNKRKPRDFLQKTKRSRFKLQIRTPRGRDHKRLVYK